VSLFQNKNKEDITLQESIILHFYFLHPVVLYNQSTGVFDTTTKVINFNKVY
jgi:hypothetical protein